MAMVCRECGAQNPTGLRRCATCGAPQLVADTRVPGTTAPPAPGTAADLPSPAGYPSPSYAPRVAAPAAMVHRTRWSLVVGSIAALIALATLSGTVLGLVSGLLAQAPGYSNLSGQVPSPSPSGTPGPSASPVPSVSPAAPVLGPGESNAGVRLPVPAGWSVSGNDGEAITLESPDGNGSLTVASGRQNPAKSAEQNRDRVIRYYQGLHPDAADCPASRVTTGALNGVPGIFWTMCFTLIYGAQTYPAAAAMFAGSNTAGSVYYLVIVLSSQADLTSFVATAEPIVQGIQWRLG
jgi:hypothetical protein